MSSSVEGILQEILICVFVLNALEQLEISNEPLPSLTVDPTINIAPPQLPYLQEPPSDAQALLLTVKDIFKLETHHIRGFIDTILTTCHPQTIRQDTLLYKYFTHTSESKLFSRLQPVSISDHLTKHEQPISTLNAKGAQESHTINQLYTHTTPVIVYISHATGLMAKDTNKSSNPYCVIQYQGIQHVSPIHEKSLSPTFDFHVALLMTGNSPVLIILWNRSSNPRKPDAFLGLVTLDNSQLSTQFAVSEVQKRTKKSHVSGQLSILFAKLSNDTTPNPIPLRSIYKSIPMDPYKSFASVMKQSLFNDYLSLNGSEASHPSRLVDLIAKTWHITREFQMADLYSAGEIPSVYLRDTIFKAAFDLYSKDIKGSANDTQIFIDTVKTLHLVLEDRVDRLFKDQQTLRTRPSSNELRALTDMIEIIFDMSSIIFNDGSYKIRDPLLKVEHHLAASFEARFDALLSSEPLNEFEINPIARKANLLAEVIAELETYLIEYEAILFKVLYIPKIAVGRFMTKLSPILADIPRSITGIQTDLADVFYLYQQVRTLQKVIEPIDFRLSEQFQITVWFKSFIRDWLDNARFNFSGWVNGAVEADTCALISPTAQFSSSVLDIFTSAQQLLDQIKELDWPNQAESQLFYYRLIHQILEALFSYCNLNISQLVKDMRPLRTVLAASAIKTAKIGKFKIRIPKLKKKTPKSPKPLNASENVARLTSSMCVRYQNVLALKHHFANLCAQVPVPSETYVADSMFYGEPRYMVHLRIVSGQQLKVSRPWNLQMAIKVTAHAGRKDLGRTRLIQQSSSGVWGDDIYSVLCDKDISGGLGFNFMQYFDNQKEFTYAVGELGLEAIKSMIMISGPHEAVVNFGEYGKLQVELEFSTLLDFSVFYRMLDWQITATQAKMKELVVDQLCHDLRDRVHSISLNYKAPKLSNFLSKQAASNPGSNLADQEHVETNLALLFEFLNVNLEILTTHMDESFSLEIVKCIWDEFLKVSERMIVPSLGDDESEKRTPWDTKRINFFELYIQSACSFFRPDEDEGLSKEQINSPAFQQLESIVKHYALSKAELLEMYYQSTILNQFGNAGTGSGKFWILKLLKLRGYGEFVLTEMRDICTTSQLKTSTAMV